MIATHPNGHASNPNGRDGKTKKSVPLFHFPIFLKRLCVFIKFFYLSLNTLVSRNFLEFGSVTGKPVLQTGSETVRLGYNAARFSRTPKRRRCAIIKKFFIENEGDKRSCVPFALAAPLPLASSRQTLSDKHCIQNGTQEILTRCRFCYMNLLHVQIPW
jgi:hypothetical protein